MVDIIYTTAKFKYDCGNYSEAAEYLYFYHIVVSVYTDCMYVHINNDLRIRL